MLTSTRAAPSFVRACVCVCWERPARNKDFLYIREYFNITYVCMYTVQGTHIMPENKYLMYKYN